MLIYKKKIKGLFSGLMLSLILCTTSQAMYSSCEYKKEQQKYRYQHPQIVTLQPVLQSYTQPYTNIEINFFIKLTFQNTTSQYSTKNTTNNQESSNNNTASINFIANNDTKTGNELITPTPIDPDQDQFLSDLKNNITPP